MRFSDADICLSGGAIGADLQWGMCAGRAGHMVIHWSYKGHRTSAPAAELVELTDEQLQVADPFLLTANKSLKRNVPFHKPWLVNLLRRNYYQIRDCQAVYAVSKFKDGKVDGGTAWAVQMAIDIHGLTIPVYVFDQVQGLWFRWTSMGWSVMSSPPPKPTGVWAGIGTRKLNSVGKQAIRELMEYVPVDA